MDLKRLELLMHVADFGSFSKASTVLGLAQPALGRQIQKLEEECGVRLLYRHGRGVTLTPEGTTLIERARPLLRQLIAIPSELQSELASPRGSVTVGLTPTVCNLLGLRLIRALKQKYPLLHVNVISGYSGYVHEWLVDGRVDLAILHDARRSSTVAVEPLAGAELFFVSPTARTTFSVPATISLSSIAEVPLVLPTRNHGLRRTLEYAASNAAVTLKVEYEVDTLDLLKEIVIAGLACTILARPAVTKEVRSGVVQINAVDGPKLNTRLVLATAVGRPLTRAVRVVELELAALVKHMLAEEQEETGLFHVDG
ncbi:Hydrogen peroxide-inducible genes activator [Paraburkholderia sediminicola]|uniref:Hydrogen peroxide-inducible genes activator n=1 Tax=Paraburkholderia sediminicola TaxID=458836 RepID=A0A6J5CU65_9BURK|nr:LysR family transcriptional regulator [Paraburkholderia sediminicola]CAB3743795.1 Hydrogen peroxide-inducible genes activator [Paraburkholderia sediminicola]